ncbi:hypothetical protein M569_14490 [Genlisea aurea]|uniref:Tudor domain-containing protein n=1 Tax=Genlisea aurea TaxID=192259 RepID=S8C0Z1_9LAMI|nr:hypothetical protein M569_14490 [Genlisea aurea]
MESVIVMMINDSDEISIELLKPLLESVKASAKRTSAASWKLGQNVFRKCSTRIKPYLREASKALNLDLNVYSEIIRNLCEDTGHGENAVAKEHEETVSHDAVVSSSKKKGPCPEVNNERENLSKAIKCSQQILQLKSSKTDPAVESASDAENVKSATGIDAGHDFEDGNDAENADLESIPRQRRRDRKPNSLIRPEEGYEHPWTVGFDRSRKASGDGSSRRRGRPKRKEKPESPVSKISGEKEGSETVLPSKEGSPVSSTGKKEFLDTSARRKAESLPVDKSNAYESLKDLIPDKSKSASEKDYGQNMVKTRIMVWWPLDKTFYTGTIESFDPETQKHKIVYDDDEEETLDLKTERWEVFDEGRSRQPSFPKPEDETPAVE